MSVVVRVPKQTVVPIWVWPILLLFAAGTIWLRLAMVSTSYEIGQTDQRIANARQAKQDLEIEVARLRSPRHLETLARGRFGLEPPRANQTIRMLDHR